MPWLRARKINVQSGSRPVGECHLDEVRSRLAYGEDHLHGTRTTHFNIASQTTGRDDFPLRILQNNGLQLPPWHR